MNRNYISIILGLLICLRLCSCSDKHEDKKQSKLYLVGDLILPKRDANTKLYDLSEYKNYWKKFEGSEYEISKELLKYKGNLSFDDKILKRKNNYYIGGVGETKHPRIETNEISALYFISALYYNDYYFASDKVLYSLDSIPFFCYGSSKERLCFYQQHCLTAKAKKSKYFILTRSAWYSVETWLKEVEIYGIQRMRELNISPLHYSNLKWLGEKGGFLNCNYPGKFCTQYERKLICPTLKPSTNRRFRLVH